MDIVYLSIWLALALLAAYIARRKRGHWVGALLLTLVVPPLGLLGVLLSSPSRADGKGASLRTRLLFGLLPFWLALTLLFIGAATSHSAEYWNAAPWILLVAVPASIVTLLLGELYSAMRRTGRTG
jgi:hypothetical protein